MSVTRFAKLAIFVTPLGSQIFIFPHVMGTIVRFFRLLRGTGSGKATNFAPLSLLECNSVECLNPSLACSCRNELFTNSTMNEFYCDAAKRLKNNLLVIHATRGGILNSLLAGRAIMRGPSIQDNTVKRGSAFITRFIDTTISV